MKKNGDAALRARKSDIVVGDLVLLRQTILQKSTPVYDPRPFRVTKLKGSMAIIVRGAQCFARNTSMLKVFSAPATRFSELTAKQPRFVKPAQPKERTDEPVADADANTSEPEVNTDMLATNEEQNDVSRHLDGPNKQANDDAAEQATPNGRDKRLVKPIAYFGSVVDYSRKNKPKSRQSSE